MKSYPFLRQDIFAWSLAVVLPLLWVVLYLNFPQTAALVIYLVVALVWVLLDRTNLMKQGITPPSFIWFWFPVVYLRQRDQTQGKPWRLMQVWLLCTVLSFVAIYLLDRQSGTENLAQSTCTTVTKMLRDEGYDERCTRRLGDHISAGRINTGYEDEMFSIRYFQKGTAHITFKRPDLVDQLNDIIARYYPGMLSAR